MTDSPVLTDVADRIGVVTLNRPEARNALSTEVLRLLPQAMRSMDDDPEVDVVILTGADPAFCAGLDLKELGSTGRNLGAGAGAAGLDRAPPTGRPGGGRGRSCPSRSSARSTAWRSPAASSWR